jgi:4-cresol dehydrogenase (hydroxylating)
MVLERMKKIERVDEKLGYAVIEPGVTYGELNRYLKDNNLALWSDCAGSTVAASVIGNALDKGAA